MSNRPTKPAQKHHTTPAGYLRRFYEPGSETLYRYENGTDMIVTRSHRSFGWVRHYHTITTGDGTRDSEVVEKYVNATFEGPGYAALEKVEARQPLTEDDRFALAQFIGFLAVRVPKAKEGVAESVGQTVADMLSMLASVGQAEDIRATVEYYRLPNDIPSDPDELKARLAEGYIPRIPVPQEACVRGIVTGGYLQIATPLNKMGWIIVENKSTQPFITSDAPVCTHVLAEDTPENRWKGAFHQDAVLVVPLSRDLALFASHDFPTSRLDLFRVAESRAKQIAI